MTAYVTIAAKFEATGAALSACELPAQLIHRPDPSAQHDLEVTPTPTTT
jgi:hypothetical protein